MLDHRENAEVRRWCNHFIVMDGRPVHRLLLAHFVELVREGQYAPYVGAVKDEQIREGWSRNAG